MTTWRERMIEKAAPVVTELRTDWKISDKRLVSAVIDAILPQVTTVDELMALPGSALLIDPINGHAHRQNIARLWFPDEATPVLTVAWMPDDDS